MEQGKPKGGPGARESLSARRRPGRGHGRRFRQACSLSLSFGMPPSQSLPCSIKSWLAPSLKPRHTRSQETGRQLVLLFPELRPTPPKPVACLREASRMQSHFSSAFSVIPPTPLTHNITVTVGASSRGLPEGSARRCIFHSFPVPFACVLECVLSHSDNLQLAFKEREVIQTRCCPRGSPARSARSPGTVPCRLQRNRFRESVPGGRAFALTLD